MDRGVAGEGGNFPKPYPLTPPPTSCLVSPSPAHLHPATRSSGRIRRHYWIQALCGVPNALGKGYFALGKAFAECSTRQRASGKKSVGKELFAECLLSGTRQSLCRVQSRHSAKKSDRHSAGSVSTCFAECHVRGAQQRFF